jgi:hypothetical protein
MNHRASALEAFYCFLVLISRAGFVLSVLVAPLFTAESAFAQESATITAIQTTAGQVELALSAPVRLQQAALRSNSRGSHSHRYYVDLSPASLSHQVHSVIEGAEGPIDRVRLSQFRAGTVRVVLDLRGDHNCQTNVLTNPLRLVITVDGGDSIADQLTKDQSEQLQTPTHLEQPLLKQTSKEQKGALVGNVLLWRTGQSPSAFLHFLKASAQPVLSEGIKVQTPLAPSPSVLPDEVSSEKIQQHNPVIPALWQEAKQPWTMTLRGSSPDQVLAAALGPEAEALSSTEMIFSLAWSWDFFCREHRCVGFGPDQNNSSDGIVVSQPLATPLLGVEKSNNAARPTDLLTQNEIRTMRGGLMSQAWMIAMSVGVVLSFLAGVSVMLLWNMRKRTAQPEKSEGWETRMAYLEEAVNRAGVLNSSFFHSLEISQKRLEMLITQADGAEQTLRRLLHQAALSGESPSAGRADSYATAALLLSEGEDARQIARTLKLPMAQVRLLHELQQHIQKEKFADQPEKPAAAQNGHVAVSLLKEISTQLNGGGRDGTSLAHNGHSL